jgi:hypothetical protein
VVGIIKKYVFIGRQQVAKLGFLKGRNERETCQRIWQFVYDHIQYKNDRPGFEEIRTPARAWADRQTGVDCDCYSVFISSLLCHFGISHDLKICDYGMFDGNGGRVGFQHIYPITKSGIAIDCVMDKFDEEFLPIVEEKIIDMDGLLAVGLNGFGAGPTGMPETPPPGGGSGFDFNAFATGFSTLATGLSTLYPIISPPSNSGSNQGGYVPQQTAQNAQSAQYLATLNQQNAQLQQMLAQGKQPASTDYTPYLIAGGGVIALAALAAVVISSNNKKKRDGRV